MTPWRRIGRRTVLAALTVYLVVSMAFLFVALTPDPQLEYRLTLAEKDGAGPEELEEIRQEYLAEKGKSGTLTERYVGWLVDVTTLDWGRSATQGDPVTTVLLRAGGRTLAYVVPAMLLAAALGIGVGLYAATHRNGLVDRLASGTAYLGLGLPDYFIAAMVLFLFYTNAEGKVVPGTGPIAHVAVPAFALGSTLFAGQLRYARAESLEHLGEEFVTLLRAKGAGTTRVARHVLRNAAVPMVSLFVTDLLAVLVLNVYLVESALGIRGFGFVSFIAIQQRDVALVLGATMVVVIVGVVGSLFQDVATALLDPRVQE